MVQLPSNVQLLPKEEQNCRSPRCNDILPFVAIYIIDESSHAARKTCRTEFTSCEQGLASNMHRDYRLDHVGGYLNLFLFIDFVPCQVRNWFRMSLGSVKVVSYCHHLVDKLTVKPGSELQLSSSFQVSSMYLHEFYSTRAGI